MLPSMLFYAVTKLTETNLNITIGSKKWIGCVRFVSGPNRCVVSVPAGIGSLNATEHGFLHINETDRNEPKHHYWVQKSGLGAFISFLARIGASFRFRLESVCFFGSGQNRVIKGYRACFFLHSNETDRNERKHHYWVPKSG